MEFAHAHGPFTCIIYHFTEYYYLLPSPYSIPALTCKVSWDSPPPVSPPGPPETQHEVASLIGGGATAEGKG